MNFFVFNGQSSLDFGIRIESYPDVSFPERIYESYQVPGRSGDLVFDTGAYRNVTQTYDCWYKPKKVTSYSMLQQISKWLLSPTGYQVLEDSYFPDCIRKAMYAGPADISSFFAKYGRVTLDFNCMPQKWLKSGQIPVDVQDGAQLFNDGEPAFPLIEISGTGSGTFGIGDSIIQISEIPENGMTIDSDTQNAYSGIQNCNGLITVSGGFPVLKSGINNISYSGGITAAKITPRWWIL